MSVATSIPCIRLSTSSSTCCSSSSTTLRFPHNKPCMSFTTIRSSQTEGPIRRPVAQPSTPPSLTPPLKAPTPPSSPSSAPPPPPPKPAAAASPLEEKSGSGVTLEFQRAKAKELQEYFKQKKLEAASQGPAFGFVAKNEISNGRKSPLICQEQAS